MLKHFLAVMLLFVMGVGAFSQSIPSGTGRYTALGSSPFILDASTDIYNNPAWNNYYRNYAFGDLNQFGESDNFDGNAGVTLGTFLGGIIITLFGIHEVIWISILLLLVSLALTFVFVRKRTAESTEEKELAVEEDEVNEVMELRPVGQLN